MKGKWRGIFAVSCFCALLCMASCLNDGDSDWFGNWQLREYRYPDGTVQRVDSVFYGFQKGSFLARYMKENGSYDSFDGYYEEKEGSITITFYNVDADNPDYQRYFGWGESLSRTFVVEEKSGRRLRLSYGGIEYVFRKY